MLFMSTKQLPYVQSLAETMADCDRDDDDTSSAIQTALPFAQISLKLIELLIALLHMDERRM